MPQSQVSQTPKTAEPHQAAAAARAKEAVTAPSAARQLASFEAGIRFLNARRLKEAREQFVDAAAGPERDVAQRARLHIAMCDRRLQQATVSLGSAEDYYNYGIALINSIGNMGGFLAPNFRAWIEVIFGTPAAGLLGLALVVLIDAGLILLAPARD